MKLRKFYEFGLKLGETKHNAMLRAEVYFDVSCDDMNVLIKEFNQSHERKLKKFEFNGLCVSLGDRRINGYLLEECNLTIGSFEVQDVVESDLGNLEISDFIADEYDGTCVYLKMPKNIFNEFKRAFMNEEMHGEDDFED